MAAIAIDTERVTLAGERGNFPIRVSIVDEDLKVLLDAYVQITDPVSNFFTDIHGITPELIKAKGISFSDVRQKVKKLVAGNLVVGHDIKSDLKCLLLEGVVPKNRRRDTACARKFAVFKMVNGNEVHNKPSLKELAQQHLGEVIQNGNHDSVEDATASMKLYKKFKNNKSEDWEIMVST